MDMWGKEGKNAGSGLASGSGREMWGKQKKRWIAILGKTVSLNKEIRWMPLEGMGGQGEAISPYVR